MTKSGNSANQEAETEWSWVQGQLEQLSEILPQSGKKKDWRYNSIAESLPRCIRLWVQFPVKKEREVPSSTVLIGMAHYSLWKIWNYLHLGVGGGVSNGSTVTWDHMSLRFLSGFISWLVRGTTTLGRKAWMLPLKLKQYRGAGCAITQWVRMEVWGQGAQGRLRVSVVNCVIANNGPSLVFCLDTDFWFFCFKTHEGPSLASKT